MSAEASEAGEGLMYSSCSLLPHPITFVFILQALHFYHLLKCFLFQSLSAFSIWSCGESRQAADTSARSPNILRPINCYVFIIYINMLLMQKSIINESNKQKLCYVLVDVPLNGCTFIAFSLISCTILNIVCVFEIKILFCAHFKHLRDNWNISRVTCILEHVC